MFDDVFKAKDNVKKDNATKTPPSTGLFNDVFTKVEPKKEVEQKKITTSFTQPDSVIRPPSEITLLTPSVAPKKNTFLNLLKSQFFITGTGGFLSKKTQEVLDNTIIQPTLDKFINTPVGKEIITTTEKATRGSSILKAVPEAVFKQQKDFYTGKNTGKDIVDYYNDSVKEWEIGGQDPTISFAEKTARGVLDSGIQSAVGVVLNLIPVIGKASSMAYYSALSASEQINERGQVNSLGNITIDVAGDMILGNMVESMFKKPAKELIKNGFLDVVKNAGKGFIVEGTTEPSQTFLKYANDYKNAKIPEEKQAIVEETKQYVKSGGMLLEFLVGGISGAGISTLGSIASQSQMNPNIPKPRLGITKDEDKKFTPEQNKIREAFREDIKQDLTDTGGNKPYVARQLSKETGIDNAITTLLVDEVAESIEPTTGPEIDSNTIIQEALNEAEMAQEETKTPEVPTEQPKLKISKEEPLITEAKKYKSAEEFINKVDITKTPDFKKWAGKDEVVEVYHGSPNEFDSFKIGDEVYNVSGQPTSGISFSDNYKNAEPFSRQYSERYNNEYNQISKKYKDLYNEEKLKVNVNSNDILDLKKELKTLFKNNNITIDSKMSADEADALISLFGKRELKNLSEKNYKTLENLAYGNKENLDKISKLKDEEVSNLDKKYANEGKVYKAYLKGKIIEVNGEDIGFGANRNELVDNLKPNEILKINNADTGEYIGTEYMTNNPDNIFVVNTGKTKSQLEEIYKQAHEGEAKLKVKIESTKKLLSKIDDEIAGNIDYLIKEANLLSKKGKLRLSELSDLEEIQAKVIKGKLTKEDRLLYNEIAKKLGREDLLPTNTLDIKNAKIDNKEYGKNKTTTNGEVQNKRGNISKGDEGGPSTYKVEDRSKDRKIFRTNGKEADGRNRVEGARIPQGESSVEVRRITEIVFPKAKKEVIDAIVIYNSKLNNIGSTLEIQRADVLNGTTEFDAGIQSNGNQVLLTINNKEVENAGVDFIWHELSGHKWYQLLSENERESHFNKIKELYNSDKTVFDKFYAKAYWVSFIKEFIRSDIRNVNLGISDEEIDKSLIENEFLTKGKEIIIPENILETIFNFTPFTDKLNTYLIENGYNQTKGILEYNNLMGEEINSYVAENAEIFKDSSIKEIKEYAESIVNNTLEFKKGSNLEFGGQRFKLKDSTKLTSADIIKKHANIQLKRDVVITDVYGEKATLKEGEGITPYEVTGNKFILQDGEAYLVSKSQAQNVINNSKTGEAKPFAPELKQTEETVKGGKPKITDADITWKQTSKVGELKVLNGTYGDRKFVIQDEGDGFYVAEIDGVLGKKVRNYTEAVEELNRYLAKDTPITKYSSYTLPGGENYKEILIKAPESTKTLEQAKKDYMAGKGEWEDFNKVDRQVFKSSHWDEPNVISHIRMNERTYNGKKVAFMEELQSDWAREGRDKGFIGDNKVSPKLAAKNKLEAKGYTFEQDMSGEGYFVDKDGEIVEYDELDSEIRNLIDTYTGEAETFEDVKKSEGGVPYNPLLKNWQELSIKRALQEAVNSGAKYFAWINGPQTAARYNLSKEVDEIRWKETLGDREIAIKPKSGSVIEFSITKDGKIFKSQSNDWNGKNLADVIGKGIAEKIMSEPKGTLKEEGLNMGGEWATNLYDRQVRTIVENLTGQKVEMLDMGLEIGSTKDERFLQDNGSELYVEGLRIGKHITKVSDKSEWRVTNVDGNNFKVVPEKVWERAEEYTTTKKRSMPSFEMENVAGFEDAKLNFSIKQNKSAGQMAIEITPEVKAIVNGEAPQVKVSGKLPFTEQITAPVMFKIKKPSNLTEEQQRIVRTPEFKKWFGDWENDPVNASKIVDEETGEPLVVYHGSRSEKFEEFNPKYIGNRDSGWFGKGFYFALSKGEAGTYGKNITEAYLNIRKPFDFSKYDMEGYRGSSLADTYTLSKMADEVTGLNTAIKGRIYGKGDESTGYSRIGKEITLGQYKKMVENENLTPKPVEVNDRGKVTISYRFNDIYGNEQWYDTYGTKPIPNELLKYVLFDKKHETNFNIGGLYGVERKIADYYGDEFTNELKKLGYDGTMQSPYGDEYVVFEPNQIKSATGNTTFGPTGNIMFKLKLPEVNTGNKLEDAKQTLKNAEKKLGVASFVNSLKEKEALLEVAKESLDQSPMKELEPYVADSGAYKGELPEVTGKKIEEIKKNPDFKGVKNQKALEFAQKGDAIVADIVNDYGINLSSEEARLEFEKYQQQKRNITKREKEFKQQVQLFGKTDTFKLAGQDQTLIGEITQTREMPQAIMEIMDQVKKEKKARREEVLNHPARPLMKYIDKKNKRLPVIGSNTAFGKEGTQILKDLKFNDIKEANESIRDYISKRDEFVNPLSRLRLEERNAKFLRDKQKIIEEVEKKIKAEAKNRKEIIESIRDYFYMTDGEMRDTLGSTDYRLINDAQFQELTKKIEEESLKIAEHAVAVSEVEWTIAQKELHRVENLQQVMGFPVDLKKMTTEQLNTLNESLHKFETGDVFLGVREIETLAKNADLPEVKTQRQIIEEVITKRTGLSAEKAKEIMVGTLDQFRSAISLSRQNAFYEVLVTDAFALKTEARMRFTEIEKKLNDLVKKARESRKRTLLQKIAPTDDMVIAYLEEGDLEVREKIANSMSQAELELAHFVKSQYAEMRDYLIAREQLERIRENYYTHRPRAFLEAWLRDGATKSPVQFIKAFGRAFKETILDVNKLDEATFKILNEQTGDILPLEKFFKYSMRRSGRLIPTKNLAKAFLGYTNTFEIKRGLDKYIPRMEATARALTPTETTEGGIVKDTSLERFVKKWINTQKGRPVSLGPIETGGTLDSLIRTGVAFTRFLDLALRVPAQFMSLVGEEGMTWINIGNKRYAMGQYRAKTKRGHDLAKQYEALIGRPFWDKMKEQASGIENKLGETVFAFYGIAARRANLHHFLGSLTKQEFESGKVSSERQTEIKMEMTKWRADDTLKSVMGATSIGGVFRQHKSWAIPILSQTLSNLNTIKEQVASGEYKTAVKSKEFGELFRATMLTLILALTISRWYKDLKDKKDRGIADELAYRAMNDAFSFISAISPTTFTKQARLMSWIEDLGGSITMLIGALATGEKTSEGKTPGLKQFVKSFTPKLFSEMLKPSEQDEIMASISKSTTTAQTKLDVINKEITDNATIAWDEVKKMGVGTEEADNLVAELSDDEYEAYKLVKKADTDYWKSITEKVTPVVNEAYKLGFGTEEADAVVDELSDDEYEMYKKVKTILYGKPDEQGPSDWDKQSFIQHITNLAKGWTTDPITAFDNLIHGDWKITKLKNGQIIVNRMPVDASQKVKEEAAKNNADYKLDHSIPLEIGGSNRASNLNIITTDEWSDNTPVENYLGKSLLNGDITGKEAREYIIRYKVGKGLILSDELMQEYKEKYNSMPITFEEIKNLTAK